MNRSTRRQRGQPHKYVRQTSIAELVARADDAWFKAHPGATQRLRPYVPGEVPGIDLRTKNVVVTLVDGVRIRCAPSAYASDTVFAINEETWEIVKRYSDQDASIPDALAKATRDLYDQRG